MFKTGVVFDPLNAAASEELHDVQQNFTTKLMEAWIASDIPKLKQAARTRRRLMVRKITLKAGGLGLLMNTNEVWQGNDGETRNMIADTLRKWRKSCRECDKEFVRGSEHIIDMKLDGKPFGETTAGNFKDAMLDITDTSVQKTNCP